MKQSIYKFRLARPELFMEKFDRYRRLETAEEPGTAENGAAQGKTAQSGSVCERRIDLKKNFRSRRQVTDSGTRFFPASWERIWAAWPMMRTRPFIRALFSRTLKWKIPTARRSFSACPARTAWKKRRGRPWRWPDVSGSWWDGFPWWTARRNSCVPPGIRTW